MDKRKRQTLEHPLEHSSLVVFVFVADLEVSPSLTVAVPSCEGIENQSVPARRRLRDPALLELQSIGQTRLHQS